MYIFASCILMGERGGGGVRREFFLYILVQVGRVRDAAVINTAVADIAPTSLAPIFPCLNSKVIIKSARHLLSPSSRFILFHSRRGIIHVESDTKRSSSEDLLIFFFELLLLFLS